MILHPGILALCLSSLVMSLVVLYAGSHAVVILHRWDISSGSELQLALERRTYLISTIVACFMAFELISLFFFINTVDSMSGLFSGAMCAVGTLQVNSLGYPTLLLKVSTFILAGIWLILNHADGKGYDYPLIRAKYLLLVVLAPLALAETVMQLLYFLRLSPDIITSCCGTIFDNRSRGIASDMVALPTGPVKAAYYSSIALTLAAGARFCLRSKGGYPVAALSGLTFIISIVSIISFIAPYLYEMPSHHCPFCMLQREYGYIGYLLYGLLLGGTITGLGVGFLEPNRNKESIREIVPALQQKLAASSMISLSTFAMIVTWWVVFSNLTLA